jgi:hypothetical protein
MSGQNQSIFDLPPGLNRTSTQYAAGRSWWNGNLIRWVNKVLTPIGGWVKLYDIPNMGTPPLEPVRSTYSWRDLLKNPWAAFGAADKLWGTQINPDGTYTFYDITPSGLGYNPGGMLGYGTGAYGGGAYGTSSGGVTLDSTAMWSMTNFGKLLMSVSSQDGRLCKWDPVTPATISAPIAGAPVDNTLVIATDEEFLMVMGGKNNPRRVKWASRRTYDDWTPISTNSAGGFDLQSNGVIIGACLVPGGILVLTDTDAHMIEYVGAPYYYGRRRVSTECDLASSAALFQTSFGAMWLGQGSFWMYNGAVSPVPTTIDYDVFYNSNLSEQHLINGGVNQHNQELWWFFPSEASATPDRYALFSFNKGQDTYWATGNMSRTAWLNPVWEDKPLGINGQAIYAQEIGVTADGSPRNVYAETGAMDVDEGTNTYRIDRVYPDLVNVAASVGSDPDLSITFTCKQAPNSNSVSYGPVALNTVKGYLPVRMRARQISMRLDEVTPSTWAMGKFRFRLKGAGGR